MYCENCGCPLNDDAVFCPNCGYKVGAQPRHGINILYGDINGKPKYLTTAVVLAFIFGSFGAHNFYLGYKKKAFAQLALMVLGLGGVSEIWAIIEAVFILTGRINTDGYGNRLVSKK